MDKALSVRLRVSLRAHVISFIRVRVNGDIRRVCTQYTQYGTQCLTAFLDVILRRETRDSITDGTDRTGSGSGESPHVSSTQQDTTAITSRHKGWSISTFSVFRCRTRASSPRNAQGRAAARATARKKGSKPETGKSVCAERETVAKRRIASRKVKTPKTRKRKCPCEKSRAPATPHPDAGTRGGEADQNVA